jgi:hypothetical protein
VNIGRKRKCVKYDKRAPMKKKLNKKRHKSDKFQRFLFEEKNKHRNIPMAVVFGLFLFIQYEGGVESSKRLF